MQIRRPEHLRQIHSPVPLDQQERVQLCAAGRPMAAHLVFEVDLPVAVVPPEDDEVS